jgi:hypothetical protein
MGIPKELSDREDTFLVVIDTAFWLITFVGLSLLTASLFGRPGTYPWLTGMMLATLMVLGLQVSIGKRISYRLGWYYASLKIWWYRHHR